MTASDMVLSESIRGEDYLLATYYLELPPKADILAKAASYAVGQMLLATSIGNDVSTSVQAKLVDPELPDSLAEALVGPRFGIEGVRKLVGVQDRPLILNMIKPCTGLTPEQGAQIFYETALGGVDLIKDDELMGNPSITPYGGYPLRRLQYLKMIQQLTLPRPHVAPGLPGHRRRGAPGHRGDLHERARAGHHPGFRGAIQGHPDGTAAGADAMRQAVDAVMAGQRAVDAAQEHPALGHALERFGSSV